MVWLYHPAAKKNIKWWGGACSSRKIDHIGRGLAPAAKE